MDATRFPQAIRVATSPVLAAYRRQSSGNGDLNMYRLEVAHDVDLALIRVLELAADAATAHVAANTLRITQACG